MTKSRSLRRPMFELARAYDAQRRSISKERFLQWSRELVEMRLGEMHANVSDEQFDVMWREFVESYCWKMHPNSHPLNMLKAGLQESPLHTLIAGPYWEDELIYLFLEPLRRFSFNKELSDES